VVLLAEVPYLVRRGRPDVLTALQRVVRFPGCPHLVYLPFLIVHRAPLVGGGDPPKDAPALSLRAQLLRTLLLLGTSVDISGGGYHPSSSFTARRVKK
jgi:hypothetical protein